MRAFNRFYTNLIGALDYSKHLYTPYTLTESRVLYELAHSSRTDAADLRAELSLDAGYLSRLLGKFERAGLVARAPSRQDPRRQRITLTPKGHRAAGLLDERSREAVGALVAQVPVGERDELVAALRTVRRALGHTRPAAHDGPLLREPRPGEWGWVVARHGALYAAEYGWDADFEALVARIVADHAQDRDPHLERMWIAELAGRPVGTVMCVRDGAPGTARLRLLLVEPEARGHGLGELLVRAVVDFAREAGYRELVLWTNDVLTGARRIYQKLGFTLVTEQPHRSFGVDLVGQDWRLPLHPEADGPPHARQEAQEDSR
ncbi:helix-turn-helix domain-containing GNAT family N-acetyltransferase [Streptomyces sp. NPDC048057]|uniref:bifunctional helix-turn-helix transcriptional regulator/GNAT family N-acetyltransferase n=1 Tax=Streptomyces sp. NPDC048057 TaxID=3155628 RepID=UPI0033EB693A